MNIEISGAQAGGMPANDLLDRRDLALQGLSELVDITTVAGPNDTVRVLVAGNTLVRSDRSNSMSVTPVFSSMNRRRSQVPPPSVVL